MPPGPDGPLSLESADQDEQQAGGHGSHPERVLRARQERNQRDHAANQESRFNPSAKVRLILVVFARCRIFCHPPQSHEIARGVLGDLEGFVCDGFAFGRISRPDPKAQRKPCLMSESLREINASHRSNAGSLVWLRLCRPVFHRRLNLFVRLFFAIMNGCL